MIKFQEELFGFVDTCGGDSGSAYWIKKMIGVIKKMPCIKSNPTYNISTSTGFTERKSNSSGNT